MKDTLVSGEILEPYAQAIMAVAKDGDLTDRFGDDTSFLLSLLNESDELKQFLSSPLVKADAKKSVLGQLAGETVHPLMMNFLNLLVDRSRIGFLGGICEKYQALLRELKQAVLAEVISAVELTDEQKEAVRQKVTSLTGANSVDLATQIDPNLLGGVVIRVGSQIIDASLRGQLRRIGLRLSAAS